MKKIVLVVLSKTMQSSSHIQVEDMLFYICCFITSFACGMKTSVYSPLLSGDK